MCTEFNITRLNQLPLEIEDLINNYKFEMERLPYRKHMQENVLRDLLILTDYMNDAKQNNRRGFDSIRDAINSYNHMIDLRRILYIESLFDSNEDLAVIESRIDFVLSNSWFNRTYNYILI